MDLSRKRYIIGRKSTAKMLGIKLSTLDKMLTNGTNVPPLKLPGAHMVSWFVEDINAMVEKAAAEAAVQ